ncbi:MAG: nitroreductase family protein [Azoarcus sp.]|jgi:nitroreductase|nr:nitroreductase family protein [Azoarcus sp.]
MAQTRTVQNGVNPLFVERWSPRAFDESGITADELKPLFEAARWAPSAYNAQPWRFIYARRGTPAWPTFLDLLIPFDRQWAERASAIVIAVSAQEFSLPGHEQPINTGYPSYDTGAAVAYLVLQASLSGLAAHIIAGFDKEKARRALAIPKKFQVESAIVIGRRSQADTLTPDLRAREAPTERRPISQSVAEGRFDFGDDN